MASLLVSAPPTPCRHRALASTSGRLTAHAPFVLLRPQQRPGARSLRSYHRGGVLHAASDSSGGEVYKGMYGDWSIEESDVREVWGYRVGLSVAAAALLLETAISFLPEGSAARELARGVQTPVAVAGGAGLGVSLTLIHIYVAPIKRFLQALWALGFCGGLFLALTQAQPLPEYVATHPGAVWLVGPFFAAVTGVAFKEGMCYGKAECAALFFVTPALLLGALPVLRHLTGLLPPEGEKALLAVFTGLALVFAARKYTQAVKDDIGDKSVFTFLALPPAEQERRVAELQAEVNQRNAAFQGREVD